MTFQPRHFGLYFTDKDHQQIYKNKQHEPIQSAWNALLQKNQMTVLPQAHWNALRYRLTEDEAAGVRAVEALTDFRYPDSDELFDAIRGLLAVAHIFEMVRDHPAFDTERDNWLKAFSASVDTINQQSNQADDLTRLWLGTLQIVAGIVLESKELFQQGEESYRRGVNQIHPEGYVREVADIEGGHGYLRQALAVSALSLMAEAALHAGVDLWAYHNRQVSVTTAATYLLYYTYYPEKWRWSGTLTADDTKQVMAEHGAFIEIVHRRFPLRSIENLLEDHRPMFDVYGGGLTTLTHAAVIKKRRGWFG